MIDVPTAPEAERTPSYGPTECVDRPIRVLLADDDEEFLALCSEALRRAGFVVDAVSDGNEFVDYATAVALGEDERPRPDVIISDVRMPCQDGFALASAVRELRWHAPVVFITALEPESLPADHGAVAVLQKPFSMASLERTIRAQVTGQ